MERSLPENVKEVARKLNKDRRTRHVLESNNIFSMDELRLSKAKLPFRVNVRENSGSEGKKLHKMVL